MNIYLADVASWNPDTSAVVTWRFATGSGFNDAGNFYAPRIENPAQFTRSIGGTESGGKSSSSFGELTLVNTDGGLNSMATHFFDGRTVTIKYGPDLIDDGVDDGLGKLITPPDSSGFTTILVATIESIAIERQRVSIRLRDKSITLDKTFGLGKFYGTNPLPYGIEGSSDDLKAKPRPRLLGRIGLMQPTLVNSSKLIYQVSSRVNLCHASEGVTVDASATYAGLTYSKDKVNIGTRSGYIDGAYSGWASTASLPAWISITFPVPKVVGEIHVYLQKDAYNTNVDPYDGQTGSLYCTGNFTVDTWNGSAWVTQATVTSNTLVKRVFTFTPVTTTSIRVYVTAAASNIARVMEIEAYSGSAVDSIINVYDAGAYLSQSTDYTSQLDMETNAPGNGQWRAWPGGGCIRLGSAPYGQLSASVAEKWDYTQNSAGGLIKRILIEKGLSSNDWIEADFTTLGNKTMSSIGVIVEDGETTANLISRICQSVGAWWGFDSLGKFRIARLDAPSGTPVASFTDSDILEIERQPDSKPPYWRTVLTCDKSYAVQDKKSLAGVVPADRVAWFELESREQVRESPSVKTSRLLADEVKSETYLNSLSQAAAEAQRRLNLNSQRHDIVTLKVGNIYSGIDIGSIINITTNRLGYGSGKLFTVTGISINLQKNTLDLTLFG